MRRIAPFRTLDALRGLAASWVVMAHCAGSFVGDHPEYTHEPLYNFSIRGQLGVAFFFVISGYCVTGAAYSALTSGKTIGRYAFERVRRIYPPYLAVLILGVAVNLVILYADAHHWIKPVNHLVVYGNDLRYWAANLFLLQYELGTGFANVTFWSLGYEVAFYVVVGIWLWLARQIGKRRGMAAGICTLTFGLAGTTFLSLLWLIVFGQAMFPFVMWHEFALGSIFFFTFELNEGTMPGYSRRLRWILNSVAAATVLLSVLFIALRQIGEGTIPHPSSDVRTATCMLFCLALVGLRRIDAWLAARSWMRPLLWLGACSYSLYLIHPVFRGIISMLARKAGLVGDLYWISFWIQFAVSIVIARIFYFIVERRFVSVRQKHRLTEEHVG